MFRKLRRWLLPNPLDWLLWRHSRARRILIVWNRGLGDIPLGLYAIVHRIREKLPEATITFLTRPQLLQGFSLLRGVNAVADPSMVRGAPYPFGAGRAGLKREEFDLVIEGASPTDWCRWQRGKLVPQLSWDLEHDGAHRRFSLPPGFRYIAVQVAAETQYGLWRNWPIERWNAFFDLCEKEGDIRPILFGYGTEPLFHHPCLIDLRGQTDLFDILSIVKNRCAGFVGIDSGLLAMIYYLNVPFHLRCVSLFADPDHGILKQNVPSPNPYLVHLPLIAPNKELGRIGEHAVFRALFPLEAEEPLGPPVTQAKDVEASSPVKSACVILAGGQASRFGGEAPKGTFPVGGKSLFEWIVSKRDVPYLIMVSPQNREATSTFFEARRYFGRQCAWLVQGELSFVGDDRRELDEQGPDGNGGLFQRLAQEGWIERWEKEGIEAVVIVPVDNPLADPAPPRLLAHLRATGADIALHCIEREERDQKMGVLVRRGAQIAIAEYCHLPPEELAARMPDGSFKYRYGNVNQFAISLPFLKKAAAIELPLHWVRKKTAKGTIAWKRERFLFDIFPYGKVSPLVEERKICYAPLKERTQVAEVEMRVVG
jgi:ADP-heptose:LPS heptosyltransferase/molybdopterin-guanine dinucleotide biosynthesis protein A